MNASVSLQKPLLIKGEPGTGKTLLAYEVAKALDKKLITWHIKSTTSAQQGLYEYDAVSRLRDSQLGDERVHDIANYIKKGKLWEAFEAEEQMVLLIDEIDKADIEFPNDLLQELDKMEFYCYELKKTIRAKKTPDYHHYFQQRKGTARCVSPQVFFPLHRLPRQGNDGADCGSPLPKFAGKTPSQCFQTVLRHSGNPWSQKETFHQRTD